MRTRYSILLLVALLSATVCQAQQREKMDIQLKAFLNWDHAPDAQVDLFIHGPAREVSEAVILEGGNVKMAMARLVSAQVPVARVHALAAYPAVSRFEFSLDKGYALNDSMRVKNGIDRIHMGMAPLPAGYDGEGVIVGVIDSGMDWQHPDFQDEEGRTRVLKYWDQTLPINSQTPQPYNYGQVWDSTQINAGLMTSVDQPQYYGHGSTVTGTVAGNGLANGFHKGCAPKADMIIVSSRFSGNFRASVADAVKFIFDEAEALGRPAVINASLGTYLGSHDGKDAAALFIDQMILEQGGRSMVCAAGNSGAIAPYHLRTEVVPDSSFTWFTRNANSGLGYSAVFFEVWADMADFGNVQYAVGADRVAPSFKFRGRTPFHNMAQNLGVLLRDTLRSTSGNRIAIVEFIALQRGDQVQLQVHLPLPDSVAYNYRFMTTGSGRFDVWSTSQFGTSNMVSNIPTVQAFPPIAKYVLPDRNQHIVDSWACSPNVLTVANFYNEVSYVNSLGDTIVGTAIEGSITPTSSKGPARTGLMKPDIAATGDITFSPAPLSWIAQLVSTNDPRLAVGGMHLRNGGTSMASPVVSGAAALYLQRCPNAPQAEIIAAILATARADNFTGALPNNNWGYGKLDAFEALVGSTRIALSGSDVFCAGGSTLVEGPANMDAYTWSNGSVDPSVDISEEGPVSLVVSSPSGCLAWSDTLQISEVPLPPQPQITAIGNELTSTAATGYQWYFNGEAVVGGNEQVLEAFASGDYSVEVIDGNGCTSLSEPLTVLVTNVTGLTSGTSAVWPSPARDVLMVRFAEGDAPLQVKVLDAAGRTVLQGRYATGVDHTLSLAGLAPGTYLLQAEGNGAVQNFRFVKQQ
jgi:subtilisin family serine protease